MSLADQRHFPTLTAIQQRSDAPFGMLFLAVHVSLFSSPLFGNKKITTQTNDETSAEIQQALLALTHHYRLLYAAIDMLYTPEEEYVFLELNAVGQLGWLEQPTGLPLFRTLALLLTGRAEERF